MILHFVNLLSFDSILNFGLNCSKVGSLCSLNASLMFIISMIAFAVFDLPARQAMISSPFGLLSIVILSSGIYLHAKKQLFSVILLL